MVEGDHTMIMACNADSSSTSSSNSTTGSTGSTDSTDSTDSANSVVVVKTAETRLWRVESVRLCPCRPRHSSLFFATVYLA